MEAEDNDMDNDDEKEQDMALYNILSNYLSKVTRKFTTLCHNVKLLSIMMFTRNSSKLQQFNGRKRKRYAENQRGQQQIG